MKPRLTFCLALVLSSMFIAGCASSKFKVVSDEQWLRENRHIVAEVTCLKATPEHYTTFSDHYLSIGAMPPRTRWNATFQINQVLKGNFPERTFALVDASDAEAYPHFYFETGKNYLVGFDWTAHGGVKNFAIIGQQ